MQVDESTGTGLKPTGDTETVFKYSPYSLSSTTITMKL